jgi:two-component system KDP operon response regulator KdpE
MSEVRTTGIGSATGSMNRCPETAVRLTPTEWRLLELFLRNPGKLLTRQMLLSDVWGPYHANDAGYLRLYVAQLRRKLEPQPAQPRHFLNEPGLGYRFEP